MAPWADPDAPIAAELWPDAAEVSTELRALLFAAAQEACEEYAPALAADATVPARYTIAVTMHARDIWNASRRSPEGTMGPEEFAVTVRPLSIDVRQLLRPRNPVPTFGTARTTVTP